ncbi:LOW QUALITY PROTEIN: Hypothetical protein PHPALM_8537 [Phytophthora palmivora]|uniref:Uncharacterized protein n=1 Tax=Phytophthora palmivora TaxID=4796 RepID=A0A2P4Y9L0_9STRA|nr:LOW QUALITY PROTEIN: Hypothetical protein PHPALM_8537 [Phytophthora palmivora]
MYSCSHSFNTDSHFRRTNSSNLRESFDNLGELLRDVALAESSSENYKSAWNQWHKLSQNFGWSPWLTKPGCSGNNKYGFNRIRQINSYDRIKLKLATVKWFHRRYAGIDLAGTPELLICKELGGCLHQHRSFILFRLHFSASSTAAPIFAQPRERLLWGSVVMAFCFLLRPSEYLKIGTKRLFYCLKTGNVFFSDKHGRQTTPDRVFSVMLGLEGAKNDPLGRGAYRTMHKSGHAMVCPVEALKHILRARQESGQYGSRYLCADLDKTRVVSALKSVTRTANVPPSKYLTDFIRIGGASVLLSGGADHMSIKLLVRWVSNCYQEYPLHASDSTRSLPHRLMRSERLTAH